MASFNQMTILGRVTRDVDTRYLPNNTPVAQFGMATNKKFKTSGGEEREETFFADLVCFGPRAEVLAKYVAKGDLLFVSAHAKTESWEDKNGGGKRSKAVFVVDDFQLMPKPQSGSRQANQQQDQGGDSNPFK